MRIPSQLHFYKLSLPIVFYSDVQQVSLYESKGWKLKIYHWVHASFHRSPTHIVSLGLHIRKQKVCQFYSTISFSFVLNLRSILLIGHFHFFLLLSHLLQSHYFCQKRMLLKHPQLSPELNSTYAFIWLLICLYFTIINFAISYQKLQISVVHLFLPLRIFLLQQLL